MRDVSRVVTLERVLSTLSERVRRDLTFKRLEEHWLLRWALRLNLTKRFVAGRWVTIGRTVYHPGEIDYESLSETKQVLWLNRYLKKIAHECHHLGQYDRLSPFGWAWVGTLLFGLFYFFLPLPVLLSGRWWLERRPYLMETLWFQERSLEATVDILWRSYLYPWPRRWMLRWFQERRGRLIL